MPIPQKIQELANKVRNAIFGKDVREAIAEALEESGKTSAEAREITEALLDGSFDQGLLDTEIREKLQQLEQDYAPQLTDLGVQLAHTMTQVDTVQVKADNNASMYWQPPTQLPARKDHANYFFDTFGSNADGFINNLFEPLRLANISHLTRTSLGKDASGTYDVWRYVFTPKKIRKTLILGAGIHGGELTGILAVYLFLKHLMEDWHKYPQLAYIRNNVRLVILPIQNPWGVSQPHPRVRQNSNGVDLNRNFDYKWSEYAGASTPFGHDYKGTAPFSEIESQYIRDTLNTYSDATAYLDIHNLGSASHDYVAYNSINATNQFIYDDLINFLVRDIATPVINNSQQDTPSAYNYSYHVKKIVSGNPEWADGRYGSTYGSVELTKALEWFGNIIIQHARQDVFTPNEPFVIETHFETGTTTITINSTSLVEINQFKFIFTPPSDGILLFEGVVTVKSSDPASINTFNPFIGQESTDFQYGFSGTINRFEVYSEGDKRQTIPFYSQTYLKRDKVASVGIRAKTTVGTVTIYRYRGRITFIPSEKADRLKVYSANTGTWVQEY
ncbi:hypothetical protein BKP37_12680 [Anaerobacillus alkalilacustris]|uniref:Peptidase M14 domain-containing protein n=1 Tax=Anaerobacillus alkalilacustris TaxID=393763 RepID=A0A1S2LKR4_9BACI|nr:M14 family metallopeptidase [Anaerobacillus alkalilacustris]OIJ12653.1 hypothetical protein BKP37_12680 [Anaerobacillus alkalilacustris]